MTQCFRSLLPSALALAASITLASPSARAQQGDLPTVLVVLPEARHDAMLAALRVELAGEALVLEGTCPPEGCSLSALRIAAEAHGADQVVWVTFPQGEIAPPHINAVRATGALEREALLPSAWDVAEPRVMAAVTASLLESEDPEPESTAPFTGSTTPSSEQSVAPEEDIEVPHGATPGPFSMQFGLAYGHHTGPQGPTELAAAPVVLASMGTC